MSGGGPPRKRVRNVSGSAVRIASASWYRPSLAGRVLIGLTMMLVAVTVWATADSDSWRAFEDHHGPVRTIAVFVLTAAVPCWG